MTMHKVLHPRDDVDGLYVLRKEEGGGLTMSWRLHRKAWRKTDYSHRKQYWQDEEQQNKYNQKT